MTLDDPDLAFARMLAERVIERLGPEAPPLRIRDVDFDRGAATWLAVPRNTVRIEIQIRGVPAQRVSALLTVVTEREQAIAATATHIQDHVLKYSRGAPLPPCPDHRHPLQASVVDGVASWVCPTDPAYHVEPILPPSVRTS